MPLPPLIGAAYVPAVEMDAMEFITI
jgi:hypothetical protein